MNGKAWILAATVAWLAPALASARPTPALYSADPGHLWNRIHRQLHVRVAQDGVAYGDDDVDPLLWRDTSYLLTGSSHRDAMALLDEFLRDHAERLITDPVKRAVFQHDLWAVFDWAVARDDVYANERHALATRLARAIRRVALTAAQIGHLPDTYLAAVQSNTFPPRADPLHADRAFLPADFFDPEGSWVAINDSFSVPIAGAHAEAFSRSEFLVLFTVPGGVPATLDYLRTLWDFREPYLVDQFLDGEQRVHLNPMLPAFPSGTRVALIRRMLVIDEAGSIHRSPLVESVQLRVFHPPTTGGGLRGGQRLSGDEDFFEFTTRRRALFAGEGGGFHATTPDETGLAVFSTHGDDIFEGGELNRSRVVLNGCPQCHAESNIQSLGIVRRLLKPYARLDYRHPRWSVYAQPAAVAKSRRFDWGLLQGLWASNPW